MIDLIHQLLKFCRELMAFLLELKDRIERLEEAHDRLESKIDCLECEPVEFYGDIMSRADLRDRCHSDDEI